MRFASCRSQIQALRTAIAEAAEFDRQRAALLTRALKNLGTSSVGVGRRRRAGRAARERAAPAPRPRPPPPPAPRAEASARATRAPQPPAPRRSRASSSRWARSAARSPCPAGEPVAYVYVENVLAPAVKGQRKVIEQAGKKFVPNWAVVQRGTAIAVPEHGQHLSQRVFAQLGQLVRSRPLQLGRRGEDAHLHRAGLGRRLLQHPSADGGQRAGRPQQALRQGEGRRHLRDRRRPDAGGARSSPGRRARGSTADWVEVGGRGRPPSSTSAGFEGVRAQEQDPARRTGPTSDALHRRKQRRRPGCWWPSPLTACRVRVGARRRRRPSSRRRRRTRRSCCRATRSRAKPTERAPVHVGDQWWAFRGDFLKLSEDKARERDGRHLGETGARRVLGPADLRRDNLDLDDVLQRVPRRPPQDGGRREDAGADRPPGGAARGCSSAFAGPTPTSSRPSTTARSRRRAIAGRCPPGAGKLSKEQIWALIYFVEYQSGGIEGRFPPSLYPRENPEHQ